MGTEDWKNELNIGDPVEADHPIEERRIQGKFLRCWGRRFCEIESDGVEYVVTYSGLVRLENRLPILNTFPPVAGPDVPALRGIPIGSNDDGQAGSPGEA